jgi:hypothetical protein
MSRNKKNKQLTSREQEKEAFERLAPERQVLESHELVSLNLDAAKAASVVLDAIPKISELLPEMQRLHDFDPSVVAGLQDRALAVLFAESTARPGRRSRPGLAKEFARARELRHFVLHHTMELVDGWKALEFDLAAGVTSGRSRSQIAKDLVALATVLRANWNAIEGKTPLTRGHLDEANELGHRLFRALSPVRKPDPNADVRARAFTLLSRSYEQVRRAVVYLRWNSGDADRFAPPMYIARPRKSAAAVIEESSAPPVTQPPPTPPPVV